MSDSSGRSNHEIGDDHHATLEQFCSYAATGPTEAFQAIFVCRTCCAAPSSAAAAATQQQQQQHCVCQACADHCHGDHDVDYVGMGPCYCDCREIGCSIATPSQAEAERLGLSLVHSSSSSKAAAAAAAIAHCNSEPDDFYVRSVFQVPLLQDQNCTQRLRAQAQELVKHSRETFWLGADVVLRDDNNNDDDDEQEAKNARSRTPSTSNLCELEQLAVLIFRQHWKHYNLSDHDSYLAKGAADNEEPTTPVPLKDRCIGAEWWVQVKRVRFPGKEDGDGCDAAAEAVDLHYDKDEALAESFGLGAFPTLSTVTYLTTTATSATAASTNSSVEAAPTVIFNQRYDESETDCISEMMVSHPAPQKHLVFDGRLLHGAPSHFALRRQAQPQSQLQTSAAPTATSDDSSDNDQHMRITFLVNIWIDHKPVAVETLPDSIRQALIQVAAAAAGADESSCPPLLQQLLSTVEQQDPLFVGPLPVPKMTLGSTTAKQESSADRIELPFVGGKATWANDDDESDPAIMVLSTFSPLPSMHESDTLLVKFEPGFEAALQYPGASSSDDEGEGE